MADLTETLELTLMGESGEAYQFDSGDKQFWCPRALVESMDRVDGADDLYEVVIPEWLASKEGLI